MGDASSDQGSVLVARMRVPSNVVYRDFGDDTVILNLESGTYHGLNHPAALIVAALDETASVAAAIDRVAGETGQPADVIEPDVVRLCDTLLDRGLIERDDSAQQL
jgi:hypothetical protein